jgi:hypothetical protein
MYKAVFEIPSIESSGAPAAAYVLLPVTLVRQLLKELDNLPQGEPLSAVLPSQVVNQQGEPISSKIVWSEETNGFILYAAGKQAGVILADELEGATQVPHDIAARSIQAQVAFHVGGMKVWRKALLDEATGRILSLTIQTALNYLPASMHLASRKGLGPIRHNDGLLFELAPADVITGFRLNPTQNHWMRSQLGMPCEEVEPFESEGLGMIGDLVKQFIGRDLRAMD